MARIRSLKPEAFSSESLAKVSVNAERTFFGMSTISDDRGRLPDKPAQINGDLWSMRGGHTAADLEGELEELVKADELVCRYVGCNGKRYLHLVTWDWHQKIDHPSKVRSPRCPHHQFSVTGRPEECGVHDGPCPNPRESVANPREPSRSAKEGDANLASAGGVAEGTPATSKDSANTDTASDQQIPEPSRGSREPSRDVETYLGPRTMDRGSVKTSRRTGKRASGSEQSALPGAPPKAETPEQRTNRLTKVYTDQVPMVKFPAAMQIVRRAVDAGVTDTDITTALQKLAAERKTLTLDRLRETIYPPNGRGSPHGSTSAQRAQAAMQAGEELQALMDEGRFPA